MYKNTKHIADNENDNCTNKLKSCTITHITPMSQEMPPNEFKPGDPKQ
jgi:hypothetical protein